MSQYIGSQHVCGIQPSWNVLFTCFFLYHNSVGWDGPAPDVSLDDETPVEVPNTRNPLEPAQYSSLTNLINPLRNSDEYGVDIYLEVLTFLQETATSS